MTPAVIDMLWRDACRESARQGGVVMHHFVRLVEERVRAEAMEEAVRACDKERVEEVSDGDTDYNTALAHAVAAIRALAARGRT
jgi:ferredoxin-NADP reductase